MNVELRELTLEMTDSLAALANDVTIFNNVRDRFPHPYSRENAVDFISASQAQSPRNEYAVFMDGTFCGMCGLVPGEDVYRHTAEVGYWIGAPYRGRGAAPAALKLLVARAFDRGFKRLYAGVYEWNPASRRVLEKAGFHLECVQQWAVTKNGRTASQSIYVLFKEDLPRQ
jgi:ribosomal-protein-alanine N-acetyltransferase